MNDQVLDDAATPVVRSDLTTALIDGELVVFDPVTSEVHQLDPVGTVIWQLLDGEATIGELVVDLADGFGVPEGQVRADVAALLATMEEHHLLASETQPLAAPGPSVEPPGPSYLIDPPAP